jgi:biofilm PGA synthesis N-glycosyltransferase PgaC
MIICLVPAHNEEDVIADCLAHLLAQTRRLDRIVVIAHNCTDKTSSVALEMGAEVLEVSEGNTKAHALNAAYRMLEGNLTAEDSLLIVDADSYLSPAFVEEASREIASGYSAVGGVFRGRSGSPGDGLVSRYVTFCKQQEYLRYERDVARLHGKALTLTGTAMLLTVDAARSICASRETGMLYTTSSLVEDLDLSVRLVSLGHRVIAPTSCSLTTETMGSVGNLWRQRVRWKEGAVRTIMDYGFIPGTRELTLRLIWGAVGIVATAAYLATLIYGVALGSFHLYPVWAAITAIFAAEHAASVYKRGGVIRAALGAILVFEAPYELFLQAAHAYSYIRAIFNPSTNW